ncbi:hypothetical protein PI95_009005 [Hassallia byssoidea VB512170]|uniref:Uncharacterized protein n=1 Tax=Hassallia byssoidea VB512170 TaxID=1304833 RepID=A0A846H602_9CYAN|nr:hypothetical protein [Hassalia byssoidea]NEU72705.1 hypothetical protein [Hassalia byssoidea VB512170]
MGNGEWGMGNGEWGMGNGEWGMGNGKELLPMSNDGRCSFAGEPRSPHSQTYAQCPMPTFPRSHVPNAQCPLPHAQFPILNDKMTNSSA